MSLEQLLSKRKATNFSFEVKVEGIKFMGNSSNCQCDCDCRCVQGNCACECACDCK